MYVVTDDLAESFCCDWTYTNPYTKSSMNYIKLLFTQAAVTASNMSELYYCGISQVLWSLQKL